MIKFDYKHKLGVELVDQLVWEIKNNEDSNFRDERDFLIKSRQFYQISKSKTQKSKLSIESKFMTNSKEFLDNMVKGYSNFSWDDCLVLP